MEMEMWKSRLNDLIIQYRMELNTQKESPTSNIKLNKLMIQIMEHYIGKENLDSIYDVICWQDMQPLALCDIEFDENGMSIRRKNAIGFFEIILENALIKQYEYPYGRFSSVRHEKIAESDKQYAIPTGILREYTKLGDEYCVFTSKAIDVRTGPQLETYYVAQLSRLREDDLKLDLPSFSPLKSHGVKKMNNEYIREHFSVSKDVPLYEFDCEIKPLVNQNDLDNSSKKM